ncbi:MAG: bestrophin family protein [Candidatus Eremiobacterota bacterium]
MVEYNPRAWPEVLLRMHGSVLPRVVPRVLGVAAVGLGASYLHQRFGFKLAPVAHTMVGAALGLLLVFRTNASYDRYWEGRKLLGSLVNRMRDLMRHFAVYGSEGQEAQRRLVVAFALIRQYLRFQTDLGQLGAPITAAERTALEPVRCRPVVYLTWLGRLMSGMPPEIRRNADENLTSLIDSIGGAERIVKTPVPFAYAQHIKGFLFLFCFTVPFVMVDSMGWYDCLGSAAVAYALFGIEEIGVEIEDPFGTDPNDLPLEVIEQGLATATREILGSE